MVGQLCGFNKCNTLQVLVYHKDCLIICRIGEDNLLLKHWIEFFSSCLSV